MRKITDLKPNEAIYIRTKKEAKAIGKLYSYKRIIPNLFKEVGAFEMGYYGLPYIHCDPKKVFEPSEFLPETKPSLKKRVNILEMQMGDLMDANINSIDVNDAKQELAELPEKWCVAYNEVTKPFIKLWHLKPYEHTKSGDYVCSNGLWYSYKPNRDEINIEQFRRWVLKESEPIGNSEQLEAGEWYIYPEGAIMYNVADGKGYGVNTLGVWCQRAHWLLKEDNGLNYRLATNEEISAALIAEAKKRFKAGDVINGVSEREDHRAIGCKLLDDDFYVSFEQDIMPLSLHGRTHVNDHHKNNSNPCLFRNGQWAEVVQPEFDWSKPGQYVSDEYNNVLVTTGYHTVNGEFSGTVIHNTHTPICGVGHYSSKWAKMRFKPYTGEPIVLK